MKLFGLAFKSWMVALGALSPMALADDSEPYPRPCDYTKRTPSHLDLFQNDITDLNALSDSFLYQPDGSNKLQYTVEVGKNDNHEPGFNCTEKDVEEDEMQVVAKSTIYGYGQDGTYTWPGKTFQVKRGNPITVKWVNEIEPGPYILTGANNLGEDDIVIDYDNYDTIVKLTPQDYSHDSVVDTSLHWAYSLEDINEGAGCLEGEVGEECTIQHKGVPIVTHLHGGHSDNIYDGNPEFFYNYGQSVRGPQFETNEYRYENNFEPTAIWYHDHALGLTRLNVYAGLAGFYFLRDNIDTGEEGNKLNLPAGDYELAYAIQDRMFKNNGELLYPAFPGDPEYEGFIVDEKADLSNITEFSGIEWGPTALAEFFGDHMVVNGKIWPYVNVEPRHYRLRLLNGCDSRFLVLQFVKVAECSEGAGDFGGDAINFFVIGTDQGFKTRGKGDVIKQQSVIMAPGERLDIVIDFSGASDECVILKNLGGDEPFGGVIPGPVKYHLTDRVMAFNVTEASPEETAASIFHAESKAADDFSIVDFNEKMKKWGHTAVLGKTKRTPRRVGLFEGRDEYGRLQPLLGTAEPATDYKGEPINWPNTTNYTDAKLIGPVEGTVGWHTEPSTENPKQNDVEEWWIINVSADAHPIHLHLVDFEVLSRHALEYVSGTTDDDGVPEPQDVVPDGNGLYLVAQDIVQHTGEIAHGGGQRIVYNCPDESPNCWFKEKEPKDYTGVYNDVGYPKDIVIALPGELTKIKAKFHKTGRYVWHCHILSHEDHEMMRVMHVGKLEATERNLRGETSAHQSSSTDEKDGSA